MKTLGVEVPQRVWLLRITEPKLPLESLEGWIWNDPIAICVRKQVPFCHFDWGNQIWKRQLNASKCILSWWRSGLIWWTPWKQRRQMWRNDVVWFYGIVCSAEKPTVQMQLFSTTTAWSNSPRYWSFEVLKVLGNHYSPYPIKIVILTPCCNLGNVWRSRDCFYRIFSLNNSLP